MSQAKTSFACASLLGILLASQPSAAWAADITVCETGCDETKIQDGIDSAGSGDTVLVKAGTYVQEFTITMKEGVTVKSEGDDTFIPYSDPFVVPVQFPDTLNEKQVVERATQTIIQGPGDATVVTFPAGADNAVLDGFTVEYIDSNAVNIPLIKVEDCSPTIQYNIVRNNQGQLQSGGIEIVGGAVDVATPLIKDNVIHYVNGHGIGVQSKSYPTIVDNEIFTTPSVIDPNPPLKEPYRAAPGIGFHDDSAGTIIGNHIFYNGAAGIGTSGYGPEANGVYDLPGYAFDIKSNKIHDNNSAPGIAIIGKPGLPTTGVSCTIGGPDPGDPLDETDLGDGNIISNNQVGVRVGFFNDNTSQALGTFVIQNNDIEENKNPGITVVNTTSVEIKENVVNANRKPGIHVNRNDDTTIESNIITANGQASTKQGGGIWLQSGDQADPNDIVLVQNNRIVGNVAGGIKVQGVINADIKYNVIGANGYGGIRIMDATSVNIEDNQIAYNGTGGIHTGRIYSSTASSPSNIPVTITNNKVHNNGRAGMGAGIDVRHADGFIENNLVYENMTAGIRFGDWIDGINHNTIVDNGAPGIVYHDPEGVTIGPMSGYPPLPIPIKNNILAGNSAFGMNPGTAPPSDPETVCDACKCDQWVNYRDFNLVSANGGKPASDNDEYWDQYKDVWVDPDPVFIPGVGWYDAPGIFVDLSEPYIIAAFTTQLGMCGPYYELDPHVRNGEIYKEPGFVDVDNHDYQLQATSLAVGAGEGGVDMGAYGGPNAIDW